MATDVRWWLCEDDAVHAFPAAQTGRGHPELETLCDERFPAYKVQRHDKGPRCLACKLIVEAETDR